MAEERKETKKQDKKLTPKQTVIQILKFVAFSMGAGIIQFVTFTLLTEFTSFPYWARYLPSLVLSVLYNFTVNRRYTFKSATNVPIAMLKVAFYYCLFTPLSTYLGHLATNAGVNDYIVEITTMLCNLVTEFLVCRFWVYRGSINTNSLAKKEEAAQQAEKKNEK